MHAPALPTDAQPSRDQYNAVPLVLPSRHATGDFTEGQGRLNELGALSLVTLWTKKAVMRA